MRAHSEGGLKNTLKRVKPVAGKVLGRFIYNPNNTAAYIQFFQKAGDPKPGVDKSYFFLPMPPTQAANQLLAQGIDFDEAIQIACSTAADGSGAPATGLDVTIFWE